MGLGGGVAMDTWTGWLQGMGFTEPKEHPEPSPANQQLLLFLETKKALCPLEIGRACVWACPLLQNFFLSMLFVNIFEDLSN